MELMITTTGRTALMMHNVQLASPLNAYARKMKTLSAKRNKTDQDLLDLARVEWEGGMYYDPEEGPYLPTMNLFRSFIKTGTMTRSGTKLARGVALIDTMARLDYDGPRELEAMWTAGGGEPGLDSPFVDIRTVSVQRNKIDRCRPFFPEWSCSSRWLVDEQVIDPEEFEDIVAKAGQVMGVGEHRLLFGRFEAKFDPL